MTSPYLPYLRETLDGSLTLFNPQWGQTYHSHGGAAREALGLYIEGSGWAAALASTPSDTPRHWTILDVGLGLGANAAATLATWWQAPRTGSLHLISFDEDQELTKTLGEGGAVWTSSWPAPWQHALETMRLRPHGPSGWGAELQQGTQSCRWSVLVGRLRAAALGPWLREVAAAPANYLWQDAFSPDRDDTLWCPEWFSALHAASAPGAVLMTYTVARQVRESAATGGWKVEKIPAQIATKRHWLRCERASPETVPSGGSAKACDR